MTEDINLYTQLDRGQIITIMEEQVDTYPSLFDVIFSLNARYWKGNSPVCGSINPNGNSFTIRNRKGPGFSLIAKVNLVPAEIGTQIQLTFTEPAFPMSFPGLLFSRYRKDREEILSFLKNWLKTKAMN